MADAVFEEPRLAEIQDLLDPERIDLHAYLALADELGASSVLDLGCGTGTLACRLAERGKQVTAVDPAAASIEVARRKSHADRVRWLVGDASSLPPLQVDLATMTGNVAQVFLTDELWESSLLAVGTALRRDGLLIFEVRDPDRRAWREWNRNKTYRRADLPQVGPLQTWTELTEVRPPFISFRMTFVFETEGAVLTSDSTLRFRSSAEISASLHAAGFDVEEVRDAPDRPGLELVFVSRRREAK
jgi:SAM-dependent methyltransferase